ncbi:MAG: hypothetical protein ACI9VI_002423, partial [Candidatus Azotimanducaceae bacterium]
YWIQQPRVYETQMNFVITGVRVSTLISHRYKQAGK